MTQEPALLCQLSRIGKLSPSRASVRRKEGILQNCSNQCYTDISMGYDSLNIGSGLYKEGLVSLDISSRVRPTVVADAHYLPFRSGIFRRALCYHVLEHVNSPRRVLTEIFRVLKTGAFAEVTTPHPWIEAFHMLLGKRHYQKIGHKHLLKKNELYLLLKETGFRLVSFGQCGPIDYAYVLVAVIFDMQPQQTAVGLLQRMQIRFPALVKVFGIVKCANYKIPFPSAYVMLLIKGSMP